MMVNGVGQAGSVSPHPSGQELPTSFGRDSMAGTGTPIGRKIEPQNASPSSKPHIAVKTSSRGNSFFERLQLHFAMSLAAIATTRFVLNHPSSSWPYRIYICITCGIYLLYSTFSAMFSAIFNLRPSGQVL